MLSLQDILLLKAKIDLYARKTTTPFFKDFNSIFAPEVTPETCAEILGQNKIELVKNFSISEHELEAIQKLKDAQVGLSGALTVLELTKAQVEMNLVYLLGREARAKRLRVLSSIFYDGYHQSPYTSSLTTEELYECIHRLESFVSNKKIINTAEESDAWIHVPINKGEEGPVTLFRFYFILHPNALDAAGRFLINLMEHLVKTNVLRDAIGLKFTKWPGDLVHRKETLVLYINQARNLDALRDVKALVACMDNSWFRDDTLPFAKKIAKGRFFAIEPFHFQQKKKAEFAKDYDAEDEKLSFGSLMNLVLAEAALEFLEKENKMYVTKEELLIISVYAMYRLNYEWNYRIGSLFK